MSDEIDSIANALRESLHTSFQAYETAVEAGTSMQNDDGTPANFPTSWMLSRLMQGGYGDAFALSDHTWIIAAFAEEVRQFVEEEIIDSFDPENGQLGLEVAFLAMEQVDWVAVGLVLRRQMIERYSAMERLKHGEDAVISTITTKKVNPEDMYDEHGDFRFPE
jgi:hypothetical protein